MKKQELSINFTVNDRKRYDTLTGKIATSYKNAQSNIVAMAGFMAEIYEKKLYLIDEKYKSFAEYAADKFGISAGASSDYVNTFLRFKKTDGYEIRDDMATQPWRKLIAMKNLDDEEIARLALTDCTSAEAVKERVKIYKSVEDKLPPNWTLEDVVEAKRDKSNVEMQREVNEIDDKIENKKPEPEINVEEVASVPAEYVVYNIGSKGIEQVLAEVNDLIRTHMGAINAGEEIIIKL